MGTSTEATDADLQQPSTNKKVIESYDFANSYATIHLAQD